MAGQATNELKTRAELAEEQRMRNPHVLLAATEEFMIAGDQEMGVFKALPDDHPEAQDVLPETGPILNARHELRQLRRKLMAGVGEGEVGEYLDAELNNDIVEIVDGLLDIMVIAWGTLLTYVGPEVASLCAYEVARSNLDKIVEDGNGNATVIKRPDGKILKPKGWVGPEIEGILKRHNIIIPPKHDDAQVIAEVGPSKPIFQEPTNN